MNDMKVHEEIDEWMAGALCDALTPDETANFQQHLADCPHCKALYEETQKMNDILNATLPELRPDPNFERRIIAAFREKSALAGFHPLRWMAWLAQFRPAQAAFAVILLCAMVVLGAVLTGEYSFPSLSTFIAAHGQSTTTISHFYYGIPNSTGLPVTSGLRSGSQAISANAIDTLLAGTTGTGSNAGQTHSNYLGSSTFRVSTGSVALNSNNTYTGATSINSGALTVTGSVNNGGTLNYGGGTANAFGDKIADSSSATNAVSLGTDRKFSTNSNLGDIPVAGHVFAQNGKFVQDDRIIRDHSWGMQSNPAANQPADTRKLIRNANLDIEIEKFDDALTTITKIAAEEQGYIATQNSDRGANGKLQGQIVVKVLPANLDRFVLKLRALGDLKNQAIGTQDVTKDYFDTEARVRNAKRTEEQLLELLKKNTNKVSELLQVEKELARVREQIEQMQGQLKFYDAMVQYATVTISLSEKDMNQPAAFVLRERANLSLFAKDVEKAFAEAKIDADAAKAQVVESHMERDGENRVSATLRLLLAPEVSDEAIGKLKALGRIQNFNSQTNRVANSGAQDGAGDTGTAKVKREKVELSLTIQRDEETAAQQTSLGILTDRVEEKVAGIKQAAASDGVQVKSAEFNHTAEGMEVSNLTFRMPLAKYPAFVEKLKSLGKVKDFTVSRREDAASENAPAQISVQIYSRGDIVADDSGMFSTIRRTAGQGFAALMWSARMIGVSLAFIAPWAISLGLVLWLVLRRRKAGKQQ